MSVPPFLLTIYREIVEERERQIAKFPDTENDPDGTEDRGMRIHWRTMAQNSCDRAYREKRLTYAHVLEEEAAEVLAEPDKTKLRTELVQLAAVCVKWIQKLDRESAA